MEFRPKRPRDLTPEQRTTKIEMDDAFEQASQALSNPFYKKKHGVGVSAAEEAAYTTAYQALWDNEKQVRIQTGLYEGFDELTELRGTKAKILDELALVENKISALEIEKL